MCRIARIDAFLDEYPDAEWGPGHIVLSDANIDDASLDFSLGLLDSLIDGTPWPPKMERLPASTYSGCNPVELAATRAFLRELRALPPDTRLQPGDELCDAGELT